LRAKTVPGRQEYGKSFFGVQSRQENASAG
jgi:hypothetical protein